MMFSRLQQVTVMMMHPPDNIPRDWGRICDVDVSIVQLVWFFYVVRNCKLRTGFVKMCMHGYQ